MDTIRTNNFSASNTESFLLPGTLLNGGRYLIKRPLGSGGFGKTYIATDTTFDRPVVVKEYFLQGSCVRTQGSTVSVSQSDNAQLFESQYHKFKKEARRLYDLDHRNIVKVRDLFDENGTAYYTMALVDGESLGDRVKRFGLLREAEVWPILDQVLDALAYIHERRLWHLDLKPDNLLVEPSGHVTLIDFGASKLMDSTKSTALKTALTAMAYTPGFAPLEQVGANYKVIGPWTDFYALGATLYSLVSRGPIPTTSDIVADGVAAFAFTAQTSKKLRDLIVWLMKPSHKDRPQSVAAIRERIAPKKTRVAEPQDVSRASQRTTWLSLPSSPGPKKRWPIAVAIVAAFVLLFWVTTRSGGSGEAEQTDQGSQEMSTTVSGSYLEHDYVDLGLPSGTLWATCNVGASSPEERGDYFAWGETNTKNEYWYTPYFDTDNGHSYKKYYNNGGMAELDVSDDAATANWGDGWRIPSKEQLIELAENCTWTRTSKNGVSGYEGQSKANNNLIFLPAAGYRSLKELHNVDSQCEYWSRSLSSEQSDYANFLCVYLSDYVGNVVSADRGTFRYTGRPVRPVRVSASE